MLTTPSPPAQEPLKHSHGRPRPQAVSKSELSLLLCVPWAVLGEGDGEICLIKQVGIRGRGEVGPSEGVSGAHVGASPGPMSGCRLAGSPAGEDERGREGGGGLFLRPEP